MPRSERPREWFYKLRARGICFICKRPMADDVPRLAHRECYRLQGKGLTYRQIQAATAQESA
jgi:hypothetical protein